MESHQAHALQPSRGKTTKIPAGRRPTRCLRRPLARHSHLGRYAYRDIAAAPRIGPIFMDPPFPDLSVSVFTLLPLLPFVLDRLPGGVSSSIASRHPRETPRETLGKGKKLDERFPIANWRSVVWGARCDRKLDERDSLLTFRWCRSMALYWAT